MRLRYLNLRDAPPLQQLAIPFWQESVLGRDCAIRFVVGVNGSGKSRLLQALAQIFLTLERAPLAQLPFFVTLAYDLGQDDEKRTIFLQYQPTDEDDRSPELRLIEYEWLDDTQSWDWENLPVRVPTTIDEKKRRFDGASGTINSFLPQALLVYTSGGTEAWQTIFAPPQPLVEIPAIGDVEERPMDWDVERERRYLREQGLDDAAINLSTVDTASLVESNASRLGYFIDAKQLRLAVAAVTLHQARQDFQQMPTAEAEAVLLARWDETSDDDHSRSDLRALFNEVGWRYPITFGLRLDFQPDNWLERDTHRIRQLYQAATTVIGEPDPSNKRLLLFDLRQPVTLNEQTVSTVEALLNVFREAESETSTPFDLFSQLYQWQQVGIIEDVVLAVRKRGVSDLILYDWLSDGEQLFMGRMALFHLLQDESDVLVLLDEPETHFNDVWKRRIVDIIDDRLRDTANEIVITTHSSIALTDVFRLEVTLLHFAERDGRVLQLRTPVHTFGASPNVIMREIFGAPESVGQRAAEFLDLILMLAAQPDDVHTIWSNDAIDEALINTPAFQNIVSFVQDSPHDYGVGEELYNYLLRVLRSVKSYTQRIRNTDTITVVDALLTLEDLIGEGFYQFEFRRRLRALRNRDS